MINRISESFLLHNLLFTVRIQMGIKKLEIKKSKI